MNDVITEITPLSENDCFYLAERVKDSFNYPLHKHNELELNFIENGTGAKRIVGDSIEVLQKYDLVLIGAGLEHGWEQHECQLKDVHELMIQFPANLFSDSLLKKTQMDSLRKLMENAKRGISFDQSACEAMKDKIMEIFNTQAGFYRVLKLYEILFELSLLSECHTLSSNSFAYTTPLPDSRRIRKVAEYIDQHYRDEIRLNVLSDLVSMTPTSFSRFFKLRTGKSLSEYIIDVRLGHASRKLADSAMSIVEICYDCGFNNVSNFNRIFKKKKNCTPTQFRENYHHRKDRTGNYVKNESSIKDKDKFHKKKEIV
ncbi:MAG: helix-turn-helix domain-containing protein [Prevotellaceae bacterium]|nr:helix-turn-helix domain-containing protein [Candidatus Minthosoma equi]